MTNARFLWSVPSYGIALLLTCRQIHEEAVDLLYSTNNFIIYDFPTFETFARSVPPQRVNAIRSLRVHWSPNTSIGYPHDRTPQYDLPLDLDSFWEIVIGMKSLRNLGVYFEAYYEVWQNSFDYEAWEVRRLEPLRRLRGLSYFKLEIGYIKRDSSISFEPCAPAFREELMEAVKRPRDSSQG